MTIAAFKGMRAPRVDLRRVRYLVVNANVVVQIFKHGLAPNLVAEHALPADAVFVRAGHDNIGNLFLVVASRTFDVVKAGGDVPRHPDTLFKVREVDALEDARRAYDTYHRFAPAAEGTLEAPPFEQLPPAEQAPWIAVAHLRPE